jgi:four helix bundle protein
MSAEFYEDLRAWQEARRFKLEIYRLLEGPPWRSDIKLAGQLREAAATVTSCIAEGFGRFEPIDNARYVRTARASLLECLSHLIDAVDRGYINETVRSSLAVSGRRALEEIGGYLDYLQSPEAKRNAEEVKRRRIERAARRRAIQAGKARSAETTTDGARDAKHKEP